MIDISFPSFPSSVFSPTDPTTKMTGTLVTLTSTYSVSLYLFSSLPVVAGLAFMTTAVAVSQLTLPLFLSCAEPYHAIHLVPSLAQFSNVFLSFTTTNFLFSLFDCSFTVRQITHLSTLYAFSHLITKLALSFLLDFDNPAYRMFAPRNWN